MSRPNQVPRPTSSYSNVPVTPSGSTGPEKYNHAGLHGKSNEWFSNLAAFTIDRIRAGENRFYEAKELLALLRAKEGWGYLCPIMRHLPELQQERYRTSKYR